jgi:hypothetical protein
MFDSKKKRLLKKSSTTSDNPFVQGAMKSSAVAMVRKSIPPQEIVL